MSLFAALLLSPAAADTLPGGTTLDPAAVVDITPEGFDAVALVIPSFLPSELEVPDTSGGSDNGFCLIDYGYSLSNLWVGIQVTDAQVVPTAAEELDVTAQLLVNVNNSSDKFNVSYDAACISGDCPGYVEPFPVSIHTTIKLAIVDGPEGLPILDATVGAIGVTYDLTEDDIVLDCWIDTLNDILSAIGLSVYDLLLDQVDSYLSDAIADLVPELETTVEEAFSSASINESFDLNGVTAQISLYPSDIQISAVGVRLVMAGSVTNSGNSPCVAAYDPGGFTSTASSAPALGSAPSGVPTPYHAGLGLTDEFVNEALYAVWAGGLLCYTVDASVFPIDTTIMGSLTGNVFSDLFPESKPVDLQVVPRTPPEAVYDGTHDIEVALEDLDLQMWAELDGRKALITTISLAGPVGADLQFDGATGNLAVELAIDPTELVPTVTTNEFYPDDNDTILAGFQSTFSGLWNSIIGSLLGDLASSLSFALPNMSGLGLQDLEVDAAGSGDWLGAYAWLGAVSYGDPSAGCGGCGEDTGASSDCSGGCSTHRGAPRALLLVPLLAAVALRRRR